MTGEALTPEQGDLEALTEAWNAAGPPGQAVFVDDMRPVLSALTASGHVIVTAAEAEAGRAVLAALDTQPESLPQPVGSVRRKWWRLGWLSAQAVARAALQDEEGRT